MDAALTAADTNAVADTYLYEITTGNVFLLSQFNGLAGNGDSSLGSAISGGGLFTADLSAGTVTRIEATGPFIDPHMSPDGTAVGHADGVQGASSTVVADPMVEVE